MTLKPSLNRRVINYFLSILWHSLSKGSLTGRKSGYEGLRTLWVRTLVL